MLTKTIGTFIACTFFLSGCGAVAPAQAEDYLQPATPEPSIAHEMYFDVRAGLKAMVSLSETQIQVRVNQGAAVTVRRVNLPLLREWGEHYLKVRDYDRDGMVDMAIMSSAGRGGKNLCYAVYRYNPQTGQFRQRKSFDRCH